MTMFLSGSRSSSTGTSSSGGTVSQSVSNNTDFYIHALRRDSTGMLYYTKVRSTDSEISDFHRLDGTPYPGLLDGVDYVEETTEFKTLTNHPQDKYQQYRFDFRQLNYFIDNDGYLVARLGNSYDYTTQGPK